MRSVFAFTARATLARNRAPKRSPTLWLPSENVVPSRMRDGAVRLGKTTVALLVLASVSAPRAEIYPIVEVKSGVLLGASTGQKWLNGKQAAKQFKPGLSFRIFDLGKEVGAVKARKVAADMDICPEVEVVSFEEAPSSGEIALPAA